MSRSPVVAALVTAALVVVGVALAIGRAPAEARLGDAVVVAPSSGQDATDPPVPSTSPTVAPPVVPAPAETPDDDSSGHGSGDDDGTDDSGPDDAPADDDD